MKLAVMGKAANLMGRTGLKLSKASPEILLGVGIASMVCGTVFACKATLKVDEILDETQEEVDKIHEVKEAADAENSEIEYTDKDCASDLTKVYSRTGVRLAKLYGPAALMILVGSVSILASYKILDGRYVGAVAAYTAVNNAFTEYRDRVKDEMGEDADRHFRFGTETKKDIEVTKVDENGEEKTEKVKKAEVISGLGYSEYAKFFDSASEHWQKSPEYNVLFLKTQQQYANDLLKTRGHLFLNEVYDMLGLPRTSAGAVVGWVLGNGDDYVDFGMYDFTREVVRDFINGYENVILLDFNVDGVIYDKI